MKCGPYWHPYAEWWDANLDGLFTVSDILPAIGRMLAIPGVVIVRVIVEAEPNFAQFLELNCATTSGGFVTLSAMAAWYVIGACVFYAIAMLHVVVKATQEIAGAVLIAVQNPRRTIVYLYANPPFLLKVIFLPYFLGRHLIAEVKRAAKFSDKVKEAAIGIFLYGTSVLLWLAFFVVMISSTYKV